MNDTKTNTNLIEKDVLIVYVHYSILQRTFPAALCTGHLIMYIFWSINSQQTALLKKMPHYHCMLMTKGSLSTSLPTRVQG